MDYTRVIKVFLASPMDLGPERKVFFQMLDRINHTSGKHLRLQFQIISWENDVLPDMGDDAQDVVNQQIDMDYDVFVSVFRDRIGTPTKRAISGTVEEYQRAITYRCSNPQLRFMCYFLKCEKEPEDIRALKKMMESDGVLYNELEDTEAFEHAVFMHFSQLLIKIAKQMDENKSIIPSRRVRKSVAVALLTSRNQVLIVKRSASCKYGPNLWQLPGGKVEPGESPLKAAVREMGEELGITLTEEQLTPVQIFRSHFLNDSSQPFDMHLYLCRVDDSIPDIRLNRENQSFEWLELDTLSLYDKTFLGINQDMIRVVWQESGAFGILGAVVDYFRHTDSRELPASLPNASPDKLHMLYSLLVVMGFAELGSKPRLSSDFSLKLLEALVCLSRSGGKLFENHQEDKAVSLKMLPRDYELLRQHRERALNSHQALLAMLSCKTKLPNSTRDVNNVLIFGKHQEELYVLLRWDFYSEKYQIFGSGVNNADEMSDIEMAKATISRRLSPVATRYFNYLPIKSFETCHFAAGSVDNDPIMRQYIIHAVTASVREDSLQDFFDMIELVNSTTMLTLDYSFGLSREQSKTLHYFTWCKVDVLLKERFKYRGRKVQGFNELISNIGQADLLRLGSNAVTLSDAMVQDTLDACIAQYDTIVRGGGFFAG